MSSNCQDNPTWIDRDGDSCEYYNMYPHLCQDAKDYANNNGIDATTSCCICRNTSPRTPSPTITPGGNETTYQTYKPCPDQQLWGDLSESSYLEVGTATCPPDKYCPRNTYSIINGLQTDIELGYGNRQGCWKNVNITTQPAFTCGDDEYCKNIDLFNSEPGKLVYKCPNATCSIGNCNCGPECMKDPRTKICVPPTEVQPTVKPGTLPSPITIEPPGSYEVPTKEPIIGPIPTPPVNICTKSQIGLDSYVCWKRIKELVNGVEQQFIVDCDPGFCGLGDNVRKGVTKIAGTDITVYSPESEIIDTPPTSAPVSVPSPTPKQETKTDNNEDLKIIGILFGVIAVIVLLLLIYYTFLDIKIENKKSFKFG